MKSTTIRICLFLVTSSMTIASVPRPEFIWYLYPKWNDELYGYNPAANTSFLPQSIVGQVVEQKDDGIHGIFLDKNVDGSNKIVLGNLADTLGNSTTFPAFTISFLYRVSTLPLPNAASVRFFHTNPANVERKTSNPAAIRLIQLDDDITLHAAIGKHGLATDAARINMPKVTQWFHISIMYHGSHDNETLVYVNGSKIVAAIYQAPMVAEPPNAKPYEYSIGYDNSPVKISMSWFQVIKGVLSSQQAKELSDNTFSQALEAVQVEVKFTISAVNVQENVGSVNIMAMRTRNVELASKVRFSAASDSAVINKDFSFQNIEFTFKPGVIYYSVKVSILEDDWTEDDENFTISVTSLDGVTSIIAPGSVTITIASNTGPGGRESTGGQQTGDDEDICLIPLILLCVGIGLVSLGIIILIVFLIKLFC